MRLLQAIEKRRNEDQRGETETEGRESSETGEGCAQPNVIILQDPQLLRKLK